MTSSGRVLDLVASSSNRTLSTLQKAALRAGEIAVPSGLHKHAEQAALIYAARLGLVPLEAAASRAICTACARKLIEAGAIPVSRLEQPLATLLRLWRV